MSIKKEIKKMLNSEKGGGYWINPYCRLNYRKTDYVAFFTLNPL